MCIYRSGIHSFLKPTKHCFDDCCLDNIKKISPSHLFTAHFAINLVFLPRKVLNIIFPTNGKALRFIIKIVFNDRKICLFHISIFMYFRPSSRENEFYSERLLHKWICSVGTRHFGYIKKRRHFGPEGSFSKMPKEDANAMNLAKL